MSTNRILCPRHQTPDCGCKQLADLQEELKDAWGPRAAAEPRVTVQNDPRVPGMVEILERVHGGPYSTAIRIPPEVVPELIGALQDYAGPTREQVGELVAEMTSCGHCDGTCGSCLEDADKIISLFRKARS